MIEPIELIHIILPIFIVGASIVSIVLKDLLSAVIALAAMSLLLSFRLV